MLNCGTTPQPPVTLYRDYIKTLLSTSESILPPGIIYRISKVLTGPSVTSFRSLRRLLTIRTYSDDMFLSFGWSTDIGTPSPRLTWDKWFHYFSITIPVMDVVSYPLFESPPTWDIHPDYYPLWPCLDSRIFVNYIILLSNNLRSPLWIVVLVPLELIRLPVTLTLPLDSLIGHF